MVFCFKKSLQILNNNIFVDETMNFQFCIQSFGNKKSVEYYNDILNIKLKVKEFRNLSWTKLKIHEQVSSVVRKFEPLVSNLGAGPFKSKKPKNWPKWGRWTILNNI